VAAQCSGVNVRGLPDVPDVHGVDDRCHGKSSNTEDGMALIQVTVIAGVFTAAQKHEIVERLTDAMASIEGESMRTHISCLVAEVASGDWGIGGHALTADDGQSARAH
jgi:4-oxalocrotonate tautomerase